MARCGRLSARERTKVRQVLPGMRMTAPPLYVADPQPRLPRPDQPGADRSMDPACHHRRRRLDRKGRCGRSQPASRTVSSAVRSAGGSPRRRQWASGPGQHCGLARDNELARRVSEPRTATRSRNMDAETADFARFYAESRDDCLRTVLASVGDLDRAGSWWMRPSPARGPPGGRSAGIRRRGRGSSAPR